MSQVAKWFERKFEFTLPVELFPSLMVRLRGTPARLEEIVGDRPYEVLTRKPDGKWSAQEHAGHLLDLEPLWLARVEDFLSGSGQLSVADLSNRKTDEANHNAHELKEILRSFRSARSGLLDHVGGLNSALFGRSLVHPRLKQPMRLVDHLYFVAEHDDHHLARIWELIN
ncbi:MAG TPA: DinB family protein [Terriglobales bacterium]|nr:DinB family protein [Terriglobales bacterium]